MLDDSQIMAQVKAFVKEEFLPDENPDDLTSDTPLVTGGASIRSRHSSWFPFSRNASQSQSLRTRSMRRTSTASI